MMAMEIVINIKGHNLIQNPKGSVPHTDRVSLVLHAGVSLKRMSALQSRRGKLREEMCCPLPLNCAVSWEFW